MSFGGGDVLGPMNFTCYGLDPLWVFVVTTLRITSVNILIG